MSEHVSQSSPSLVARQAANAMMRRRFVDAYGRMLVWAMGVAIVCIGCSKLFGWAMGSRWWWGWIVLAVVSAAVPAMFHSIRQRMNIAQGGGLLDEQLGLKSQIRSAIELDTDSAAQNQSPGFVELAKEQGSLVADGVEIASAMPIAQSKQWKLAAGLVAVAIVIGIWMPMMDSGKSKNEMVVPESAIAKLNEVEESLEAMIQDQVESDEVDNAIEELGALKEELANGVQEPEQANARAAAKLEEIADDLDDQAEENRIAAQELSDRLAQAQNQTDEQEIQDWNQQLDDFSKAIQEQRYDDADKQFDELKEQLEQLTNEERDALADRIEELADAVEPDSLEDEPAQDLADSIRDEAQEIREQPDSKPDSQEEESTPDDNSAGDETPEKQEENEQDGESESEENGSDTDRKDSENEREGEGEEKGDQGDSQRAEEGEPGQEKPSGELGEKKDAGTQEQREGEKTGEQQMTGNEEEGEQQGEEKNEQESDEGGETQGERSVEDALEKMQERKERGQRNQEQADKIREQAKELIGSNEEAGEQEDAEEGVVRTRENQEPQKGSGGDEPRSENEQENRRIVENPNEFAPVDASNTDPNDDAKPVGKWYAPEGKDGGKQNQKQAVERLRQASKKAQRAADEQKVPRKYRQLVRDAFKRVSDRADAIESGGQVAPQGQDAVSGEKNEKKKTESDS